MGRAPLAIVDFSEPDGTPLREVFRDPIEVIVAQALNEVIPAIDRAEQLAKAGKFAVGFVAYDAAPAFEPRFAIRPGYRGPLVWFGIFNAPSPEPGAIEPAPSDGAKWVASVDAAEHARAVDEIIEGIRRGDFYQVSYTARFGGQIAGDSVPTYERLRRAQGGRYSAFIDTGALAVLSVSPELFFSRVGDQIESRPMKGTAARGRWPAEDDRAADRLRMSEKERAENVMIVDLIRNDLGRVAVSGTVEVSSLFDVERYPTVLQMTSHVKAQVKPGTALTGLFRALFPCGSVTGAPKIAASKSIADFEAEPRGVYCGAVGVVRPGGDSVFNVAIRTMTVEVDGSALYGAGGGITVDSNPADEYRELVAKTVVLDAPPEDFDLFETMRLEGGVIARFDRHLDRLAESARYFGFRARECAIDRLRERLDEQASAHREGCFRVRATLSRLGEGTIEIRDFQPSDNARRVRLSRLPVNSSDRLLYHKTTRRDAYDSRLAAAAGVDDVLLFNERGELTETTIGNVILEVGGELLTPPLDSGLLPGILRQELLDRGEITETVIPIRWLYRTKGLWMINSLRGWVPLDRRGW